MKTNQDKKIRCTGGLGPLLAALALVGGCTGPGFAPAIAPRVVAEGPAASVVLPGQYRIVGRSVEGRPILIRVVGEGKEVTFILAGIHGDERAGTSLVRRLAGYLDDHSDRVRDKTILLLPLANPDARAKETRENARSVDVNRNFPADNRVAAPQSGPWALSEPESRAIYRILREYRPERVVSLHQPLGCVDYDGPAEELAGRMSGACGLPVRQLGARPGSLGSYLSQVRGVPIITLELLESDSGLSEDELWSRYGAALLVAVE